MTPAAALAALLEALPLLAMLVAFWAHWRADHAAARLAQTRLELIELVSTVYEESTNHGLRNELRRMFPEYTQGRRVIVQREDGRRAS